MKKKNKKAVVIIVSILLSVVLALILIFIWRNSLDNVAESTERSLRIKAMVTPYIERFVGKGNVTDHLVRKIAHFVEFNALGCVIALFALIRTRKGLQPIINCMFVGMTAALIDETIQIFSDRGSQVQDIWLDFAGAVIGIIIITALGRLIIWIINKIIKKKSQRKKEKNK